MRLAKRIRKVGRTIRRHESGISLIEGMAGMIMLSLGLLTLLPLATISLSGNELARDTADAAAVMQNQIERLRNQAVITDGSETDPETGMYSHWWVETDPNGCRKSMSRSRGTPTSAWSVIKRPPLTSSVLKTRSYNDRETAEIQWAHCGSARHGALFTAWYEHH